MAGQFLNVVLDIATGRHNPLPYMHGSRLTRFHYSPQNLNLCYHNNIIGLPEALYDY